ncbi:MAG: RT0821/Lpp0805 family surface protein [Micavibrio sp.]
MKKFIMVSVLAAGLALSGCTQTSGTFSKENIGLASGAVIGGVLGSQVGSGSGRLWATGAGALLGSLVGSNIGQSLDRADQMYMQQATQKAHTAPVGETISWNNPDSGHSGTITPTRDGTSTTGRYCREYQTTVTVGGKMENAYGQVCQQPDGSWEIVK